MKNYTKIILAITLIVSTSSIVQAKNADRSRNGPPQRPSFESIDVNENGDIDFDEFSSQKLPHGDHQTVFDTIDTDSNGIISNDEFVNHKPPQHNNNRSKE